MSTPHEDGPPLAAISRRCSHCQANFTGDVCAWCQRRQGRGAARLALQTERLAAGRRIHEAVLDAPTIAFIEAVDPVGTAALERDACRKTIELADRLLARMGGRGR